MSTISGANAAVLQTIVSALTENGWKYIPADSLPRKSSDVMVEPMVRDALIRLNPEIAEDPSRAELVIGELRAFVNSAQSHNLTAQNEEFRKTVFGENSYPFGRDARMIPIKFFDAVNRENKGLNEYVVTSRWSFLQNGNNINFDVVLLVNGFPLVAGEVKTPVRDAITWLDAACQISSCEKSVPAMFVTNVFSFGTEGKCYRYGSIGMPANMWGHWNTARHKSDGVFPDAVIDMKNMITPENVMDIFRFFTAFHIDNNSEKQKIICRRQQFEGANLIVDRVVAGHPKNGLIWHSQGSGKTLLMLFAVQKLRNMPELENPTVVIAVDHVCTETQLAAEFDAHDISNFADAPTKKELSDFFENGACKILITNIFAFGEIDKELDSGENIIVIADEIHGMRENNSGEKMRIALPNAFFFGLTGTPVNLIDKKGLSIFGTGNGDAEYMSRYSFSESVSDNVTLPLRFETVPAYFHVDKDILRLEFDAIPAGTDSDGTGRAECTCKSPLKEIMRNPVRIRRVCEHISKHYKEKIEPNGYKGLVAVYDRECCLLYKKELDGSIGENATAVVDGTRNDKEEKKLLDNFLDPCNALKLIIVASRLLTGFDAPILQVMYLDKPLKDHALIQAVCRTNRVYDRDKTQGLIVDYVGIFDDMPGVLDFDEKSMRRVITDIEEIKKQFPALLKKCLSYFMSADRTVEGLEGLAAAGDCLPSDREKDAFAADYIVLNRMWKTISHDNFLNPYRDDYRWLSCVYESIKPADGSGKLIWGCIDLKTRELLRQYVCRGGYEDIAATDADSISDLKKRPKDMRKTTRKLEIALAAGILERTEEPKFVALGEKLESLRKKYEEGHLSNFDFLKLLLDLAKETSQTEKEIASTEKTSAGMAALTELYNGAAAEYTSAAAEQIATDIDRRLGDVCFDGWQNTAAGENAVKHALRGIVWIRYKIKDKEIFDKTYACVRRYY